MSLVGTRVRNFLIERELGRGGMGEVYVAFDQTLERRVALKSIRPEHRLSAKAKARFLREARMLSRLDHPGICRIHEYIDGEEADFLVLELIEGRTLNRVEETLDAAGKLAIAQRLADVLIVAHAAGVVHRDLKPENVMVTPDGGIKVLDFGLAQAAEDTATRPEIPDEPGGDVDGEAAGSEEPTVTMAVRLTGAGRIIGTPAFMSPEQARGEPATPASDLYSLGLTLQRLFTGQAPYDKPADLQALMLMVERGQTRSVDGVDADLAALIERMKSVAPTRRPTAVEVSERLRWIADKSKRRTRRLVAAGVLLVIAAAGAKYTLDLRFERAEADRRRAQAEDLIEFMLGDLREKLEPVGRLDVLHDVGDKALDYFASLREAELTAAERFRLSKAMSQIGEVRVAEGDLAAAMQAFEESLAIAEDVVSRDPDNGNWWVGLGAAYFWTGSVHFAQGDTDAAESRFQDYLRVSQRLVELDPANQEWQLELGYAHTNLAAVHEERGDTEAALESLAASVAIKRRLVESSPGDMPRQVSLANSLDWLAVTLEGRGDLAGTLENRTASLAIRESLAGLDPRDMDAQRMLSIAHGQVGQCLRRMGRDTTARDHFDQDLAISKRLVGHEPENAEWRRGLAAARLALGTLSLAVEQTEPAAAFLELALAEILRLVELEPTNADWRADLAEILRFVALVELARGRPEQAARRADSALATARQVAAQNPQDPRLVLLIGEVLITRGRIASSRGHSEVARQKWLRALDDLAPLATPPTNNDILAADARARIFLGLADEAREVLARLASAGYAETDLARLCRTQGIVQ